MALGNLFSFPIFFNARVDQLPKYGELNSSLFLILIGIFIMGIQTPTELGWWDYHLLYGEIMGFQTLQVVFLDLFFDKQLYPPKYFHRCSIMRPARKPTGLHHDISSWYTPIHPNSRRLKVAKMQPPAAFALWQMVQQKQQAVAISTQNVTPLDTSWYIL